MASRRAGSAAAGGCVHLCRRTQRTPYSSSQQVSSLRERRGSWARAGSRREALCCCLGGFLQPAQASVRCDPIPSYGSAQACSGHRLGCRGRAGTSHGAGVGVGASVWSGVQDQSGGLGGQHPCLRRRAGHCVGLVPCMTGDACAAAPFDLSPYALTMEPIPMRSGPAQWPSVQRGSRRVPLEFSEPEWRAW